MFQKGLGQKNNNKNNFIYNFPRNQPMIQAFDIFLDHMTDWTYK